VDALFRKAGIVRCYGREDLISVASVFMHKPLSGKNIAIITHAGGPAVMLTDALSHGGLKVPHISGKKSQELLTKLYPGSSVANPIDFLATGTAEQLGTIIDYTDNYFDDIDAMAVIFGTPGLTEIFDVYDVLHHKMATCTKPIYPVLPSTLTAQREVAFFLGKGHVMFPDEVTLGNALSRVYHSPHPVDEMPVFPDMINADIRAIIDGHGDGYLPAGVVEKLLDACGIPRAKEMLADTPDEVRMAVEELGFPLVCKVVGPLHKSDLGGVVLNINSMENALQAFEQLMKIQGAQKVLIQPMISGIEMFAGVKKESAYGHLIVCGLGGVHIEVLQDIAIGLAPLSPGETESMLRSLRGYKIMEGVRGRPGIDKEKFKDVVRRLGALVSVAPEIAELDLNPVLCGPNHATVVDVRIRIEKN
jgi:acetyltransferase